MYGHHQALKLPKAETWDSFLTLQAYRVYFPFISQTQSPPSGSLIALFQGFAISHLDCQNDLLTVPSHAASRVVFTKYKCDHLTLLLEPSGGSLLSSTRSKVSDTA